MMKGIRFHGRGGEGVVIAAELLAAAAFKEGSRGVQSFPFFGGERRGAPVTAFVRISDRPIRLHGPLYAPNYVVVLSPFLPGVDVTEGIKRTGLILINGQGRRKRAEFEGYRVVKVDATKIAVKLGLIVAGSAVVNTVMLGALARATKIVTIDSIKAAIMEWWPDKTGEKNAEAAMLGYMLLRGIDKAG
jgi:2-oxoacid:acceptor oxidoreductase gamma subunit (pyruvate/2-ketoisovalerate family)